MKDQYAQMMLKLNEGILSHNENVKEYMKVRNLHQEIIHSMMNDANKNKMTPVPILEELGIEDFVLHLSNEIDEQIYGDLLLYPHVPSFRSMTEIYLEKHRYRNEEKIRMLEAMKNSELGLYEFIDRDNQNAIVKLRNVVTLEERQIIDRNLGCFGNGQGLYFFLRIINYDDISFQTGMALIFKRNNVIKKWIKRNKHLFDDPTMALIELFTFYQKYGIHGTQIRYMK